MKVATLFSILLILGLAAGPALSDPLSPPDQKPWSYDYSGFNLRATYPEVEPNDACPGQAIQCEDIVNPAQISASTDNDWYEIALTAGSVVTIATDASDLGDPDLGDSYVELYGADCAAARLTYDDDGGPGAYSLITNYAITTTGLYHIKVRGYSASYVGYYKLFVTCVVPPPPPPPPANDTCAGAILLARCTSGTIAGDLTYATNDYSPQPPSPGCTGYAANGKDVVYELVLEAGDQVLLVYTTPNHDGSLYIVTDCTQPGATCVIGEDDPEPETINWTAPSAGTYFVIADAYTTAGGADFTLDYAVTCPPPAGACCFVNGSCSLLGEADCATQGGTWYGVGSLCEPNPCPQPPDMGACCAPDGSCTQTAQADCAAPAVWFVAVPCDPNPCPPPPPVPGACCFAIGVCEVVLEADCVAQGGTFLGEGVVCDPNPCPQPPLGACCLGNGECVVLSRGACADVQGVYQGDGTGCDPNPCPPNPTETTTWGHIKHQYR